ncbi:hypothetical protein KEM52_001981 [Ascosphaera acerosa]|nr:hypothetical protein KEM52_001981 [Ascosphaera acerosa]
METGSSSDESIAEVPPPTAPTTPKQVIPPQDQAPGPKGKSAAPFLASHHDLGLVRILPNATQYYVLVFTEQSKAEAALEAYGKRQWVDEGKKLEYQIQPFGSRGDNGPCGYLLNGGPLDVATDFKVGIGNLLRKEQAPIPAYTLAPVLSGGYATGQYYASFESAPKFGKREMLLIGVKPQPRGMTKEGKECAICNRKEHKAPECTLSRTTKIGPVKGAK